MLEITVDYGEFYDEETEEFVVVPSVLLKMEHSLTAIAKWESIYRKPFLVRDSKDQHTPEEMLTYFKCMTLNEVDEEVYRYLNVSDYEKIIEYIGTSQTATTIRRSERSVSNKITTSEELYCSMVMAGIPPEYADWNFSRLMTLIEIYNIRNNPKKTKRAKRDISRSYRELNEQRRAAIGSSG